MSEEIAVRRAMDELDALALTKQMDGVISDDVPASHGVHTDLVALPLARSTRAPVTKLGTPARFSRDLG